MTAQGWFRIAAHPSLLRHFLAVLLGVPALLTALLAGFLLACYPLGFLILIAATIWA